VSAFQVLRKGGRILLLEHGRSTFDFLNNILDADAAARYDIWGCWWNRDIVKIAEEAGLEVELQSRWHFGTTVFMVARTCNETELDHTVDRQKS
jgi:methyltransferase OMS1, mitochondrial